MINLGKNSLRTLKKWERLLFLLVPLSLFWGCVEVAKDHCRFSSSAAEISRADDLVKSYLVETRGQQQAKGFSDTYEVVDAKTCSNMVTMVYAPKELKSNTVVIVGARVLYSVDLALATVQETYLE